MSSTAAQLAVGAEAPAAGRPRQRRAGSSQAAETSAAAIFLTPYLILFLPFLLVPCLFVIVISLTDWQVLGSPTFVGLANYVGLFRDKTFTESFVHTLYFVLLTVPAMVIFSLLLAVLVNQKVPGRNFVRAVVFLPQVVSVAAIGIIWGWMLEERLGIVNFMSTSLGGPAVAWLNDPRIVLPSIALVTIWWTVGGNMIIYLAGLQDISPELYEAARIDGASAIQQFLYVTVPQLREVTAFVLAVTAVGSFNAFGQVYVLTGGGPNGASFVLGQYIYQKGFVNFELGPASAASVVLMLLTLAVTGVEIWLLKTSSSDS